MADAELRLEMTYTVDELAVLAELLQTDALPGAPVPEEVGPAAKAAAARSLVARGVLAVLEDDAVEVLQPHATLLAKAVDPKDDELTVTSTGALTTYALDLPEATS
jgi:hypothetical protein